MDKSTRNLMGAGVGTVMAGGAWMVMRNIDRNKLVSILKADKKIPLVISLARVFAPPKSLALIAEGKFEEEAAERLSYINFVSPEGAHALIEKEVDAYVASVPAEALESLATGLGMNPDLFNQIKKVVNILSGGSGVSGQGQR